MRGLLYVAYSGMDTLQYYGPGNETVRDSGLASSKFYDVRQKIFVVNPMMEVPLFGPLRGRVRVCRQAAAQLRIAQQPPQRRRHRGDISYLCGQRVLAVERLQRTRASR